MCYLSWTCSRDYWGPEEEIHEGAWCCPWYFHLVYVIWVCCWNSNRAVNVYLHTLMVPSWLLICTLYSCMTLSLSRYGARDIFATDSRFWYSLLIYHRPKWKTIKFCSLSRWCKRRKVSSQCIILINPGGNSVTRNTYTLLWPIQVLARYAHVLSGLRTLISSWPVSSSQVWLLSVHMTHLCDGWWLLTWSGEERSFYINIISRVSTATITLICERVLSCWWWSPAVRHLETQLNAWLRPSINPAICTPPRVHDPLDLPSWPSEQRRCSKQIWTKQGKRIHLGCAHQFACELRTSIWAHDQNTLETIMAVLLGVLPHGFTWITHDAYRGEGHRS